MQKNCIFLLLAVIFASISAHAATDYGFQVAGTKVTSSNASNITSSYLKEGTASYNASTNTLTLNSVYILRANGSSDYGIRNQSCTGLTIKLIGYNELLASGAPALYFDVNTTITSDSQGTLLAECTATTSGKSALSIQNGATVTFSNLGSTTIQSDRGYSVTGTNNHAENLVVKNCSNINFRGYGSLTKLNSVTLETSDVKFTNDNTGYGTITELYNPLTIVPNMIITSPSYLRYYSDGHYYYDNNKAVASYNSIEVKERSIPSRAFVQGNLIYEPTSSMICRVWGLSTAGKSVSTLTIPGQVTYGGQLYYVNSIADHAFENATNLRDVTLRYGIEGIGDYGFAGCTSLVRVHFPSSFYYWYNWVFYDCPNLTQMYFAANTPPSGLNLYAVGFPTDCTKLQIYLGKGNGTGFNEWCTKLHQGVEKFNLITCSGQAYDYAVNGTNYTVTTHPTRYSTSSVGELAAVYFISSSSSTTMRLEDWLNISGYTCNVTSVIDSACVGHSTLTEVDLSGAKSLKSVGVRAFYNTSKLTTVTLGGGDIGSRAFYSCPQLSYVKFKTNSNNGSVGDYAFYNCSNLLSVNFEANSIKSLGNYSFAACPVLKSLLLPEGLQSIGSAFIASSGVSTVTIPASVSEIKLSGSGDNDAFFNAKSLYAINVNNQNTTYTSTSQGYGDNFGASLYSKDYKTLLRVPEGFPNDSPTIYYATKTIANRAMLNCTLIKNIEIPWGVTTIDTYAFYGCTALKSLHIPSSVTNIGSYVAYGCNALERLSINIVTPPSNRPILSEHFSNITLYTPYSAHNTYVNSSVWKGFKAYNPDGYYAYDVCKEVEESGLKYKYCVSVYNPITKYGSLVAGYCLKGDAQAVQNLTTAATITFPSSIQINWNGSASLRRVDANAFRPDNKATNASMGSSILTINLPATVTEINDFGFWCANLKQLTAPNVTKYGYGALCYTPITQIPINKSLKTVGDYAFSCPNFAGNLILPYGITTLGKHIMWNAKPESVVVPSSVTSIDPEALDSMKSCNSLYINLEPDVISKVTPCTHLYVPSEQVSSYKRKFSSLESVISTGAYDFADVSQNNGYVHYTVDDNNQYTVNGKTYAGQLSLVHNPNHSAAPTTLTLTGEATDNYYGGTQCYVVTKLDNSCFLNCPSQLLNDYGLTSNLVRIGSKAFMGSNFTYYNNASPEGVPSNLFHVAPSVSSVGEAAFAFTPKLDGVFVAGYAVAFNVCDQWDEELAQRYGCNTGNPNFKFYVTYDKRLNYVASGNEVCEDHIFSYCRTEQNCPSAVISTTYPVDYSKAGLKAYKLNSYDATNHVLSGVKVDAIDGGGVYITGIEAGKAYLLDRPEAGVTVTANDGLLKHPTSRSGVDLSKCYLYLLSDQEFRLCDFSPGTFNLSAGAAWLDLSDVQEPYPSSISVSVQEGVKGDVNGDGIVDVTDVNILINMILGTVAASPEGDINGDGVHDVTDANILISLILGK